MDLADMVEELQWPSAADENAMSHTNGRPPFNRAYGMTRDAAAVTSAILATSRRWPSLKFSALDSA